MRLIMRCALYKKNCFKICHLCAPYNPIMSKIRYLFTFTLFVNKTCFYSNIAKFESFYFQAKTRRCSGCRVLALVALSASSRLNFKRNRPPTFCAKHICFRAAFRDDYTMQSLKIICAAWRRADSCNTWIVHCVLAF